MIGIAVAVAPYFARLSQTLASSVAGSDYLAAARMLGVGRVRLLRRHILPNVAEPLLITTTIAVGDALLALAGLSFLGLGVQPPQYDWGRMLNEGLDRLFVTPIVALGPAIAITLAALTFTLFGEVLAKAAAGGGVVRWTRSRSHARADAVGRAPRRPSPTTSRHAVAPAAAEAVLALDDLTVSFPGGSVPVRERQHPRGAGRDRRHRRRVRLGQDADRDGDRRPAARERAAHGDALRALRRGSAPARATRSGAGCSAGRSPSSTRIRCRR